MGLRKLSKAAAKEARARFASTGDLQRAHSIGEIRDRALQTTIGLLRDLSDRVGHRAEQRNRWQRGATSGFGESTRGTNTFRAASRRENYLGWEPELQHPDMAIENESDLIRGRTRDLMANSPIAAALTGTYVSHVCGHRPWTMQSLASVRNLRGVMSASRVREWRRLCELVWNDHADLLDLRERTFSQVLRDAFTAKLQGDGFVEFVRNRKARKHHNLSFGLRVHEGDLVRTPAQFRAERDVRMGVRYDEEDAPDSYYLFRDYPGDRSPTQMTYRTVKKRDKLGRLVMGHQALLVRASQGRGVSWLLPVVSDIEDASALQENELLASMAAGSIGLILKNSNSPAMPGEKPAIELRPGGVWEVPDGFEPQAFNPQRPHDNFAAFQTHVVQMACSALQFSWILALRRWENTSYSVLRAAISDAKKMFELEQDQLAATAVRPAWEGLMEAMWTAGLLPSWAPLFDNDGRPTIWTRELLRMQAMPPSFGWLSPREEVSAFGDAVKARFMSRGDVIRQTSQRDPEEVFDEIAEENEQLIERGLATNDTAAGAPSTVVDEPAAADAEPDPSDPAEPEEVDEEEADPADTEIPTTDAAAGRRRARRRKTARRRRTSRT